MVNWRRNSAVFLLLFAGAVSAWAQSDADGSNPLSRRRGGIHITSAGVFGGYASLTMPSGSGFLANAVALGPDYNYGGEATIRADRFRQRSSLFFSYNPSVMGLARHSEWNSFNHVLSLGAQRQLGRKWDFSFGLNGSAMSLSQYLFTPMVLTQVTTAGATFDDLAAAIISGNLTNNELASILTGAPVVESPARTLIYGNRILSAGATTSLSYSPSTRLSVHISASATRAQYLNDAQDPDVARYRGLIPRTSGGSATAGFSYKVTRRTEVGMDVSASRTFSRLQDAYTASARLRVGRKISNRWFVAGYGGAAKIIPIRETYDLRQRPQFIAGASLGFRTRAQTFVASGDRTVSDSYGLGAGNTLSVTGSWSRHRRGGAWRFSSGGGWQRLEGGGMDLEGWIVIGSIARRMSRQTSMQLSYAYMTSSYANGPREQIDVHSVRLAFMWSAHGVSDSIRENTMGSNR